MDKIDTKFQKKTQESDVVGQIEDWMINNKMNLQKTSCGTKKVTSVYQRENMLEKEAGRIRSMVNTFTPMEIGCIESDRPHRKKSHAEY